MSFINIRKTALVAAILNTIIVIWSFRNLLRTLDAVGKDVLKQSIIALPIGAVGLLSASLAILFYFALSVNKLPLKIAPELRRLALYAAIVFGVITLAGLPSWTEALKDYLIDARFSEFDWPERLALVVRLAGEASNLAYIVLLVLLWRAPAPDASDPEVPGLLDVASRLSVMTLGLWLAFSVCQAGYLPIELIQLREKLAGSGRESFWNYYWLTSNLPRLLTAACMFVAPYVVCVTQRMRPRPIASNADEPLAFLEPPVPPLDPQSP